MNVSFEDIGDEIETNTKMGFIEFNNLHERIPSCMNILGKLLKKRAAAFWESKEDENDEFTDL